jgi:hypothetical protein
VLRSVGTIRNYWPLKVHLASWLPRVALRPFAQFVKNMPYSAGKNPHDSE